MKRKQRTLSRSRYRATSASTTATGAAPPGGNVRHEEATPQRALTIVRCYGTVLRQLPLLTTGLPESLLPYPAALIQEAIEVLVQRLETTETDSTSWALEDAYTRLAFFVPDDDAAVAAQAHEAELSSGPQQRHGHDRKAVTQMKRRITERQQELLRQFRRLQLRNEERGTRR